MTNGLGSLIIGYNELRLLPESLNERTGSHNIASGRFAPVSGGGSNRASSDCASVSGENYNKATGNYTSVNEGVSNEARAYYSTVLGGSGISGADAYGIAPIPCKSGDWYP